jgi:predicted unusual protein kinase regulating ubiquinone biosynthesis (AarF/ABC1/UbiB family)
MQFSGRDKGCCNPEPVNRVRAGARATLQAQPVHPQVPLTAFMLSQPVFWRAQPFAREVYFCGRWDCTGRRGLWRQRRKHAHLDQFWRVTKASLSDTESVIVSADSAPGTSNAIPMDVQQIQRRYRYTEEVEAGLRGWALVRQDWRRLRSWITRRGRAEFLHYDLEAFARFYRWRFDLVIARAATVAFPLLLWFVRYRWRLRDPELRQALANEKGIRMDASSAAELRALAVDFGATAIKLGQTLSSRPDIVGPTFMVELQKLQDDVGPFPKEEAWALLRAELGAEAMHQLFGNGAFDASRMPEPVASASLGQVYRAQLSDSGMEVAVKVQRPRLHLDVPLDLLILRWLADKARKFFRLRSDLPAIVDEFGERLFEEMDYVHEAMNAERFRSLYARAPSLAANDATLRDKILVPRILWRYTTPYVLALEWINGLKPSQWEKQDALRLIRIGVASSLQQLLDDGFFHADPHPGNFLCSLPEGRLVYLDFGCMAELDADRRYHLIMAITHLINKEYAELSRDLVALDFLPPDVDPLPVSRALEEAFEASKRASNADAERGGRRATLTDLNFATLTSNLGRVAFAYPIRIPASLALVMRSLTALEGLALKYDPGFRIVDAAYPYVARRLLFAPTPALREAVQQVLLDTTTRRIRWNRLFTMIRQSSLALGGDGASSGENGSVYPDASSAGSSSDMLRFRGAAGVAVDPFEPMSADAAWNLALEYLLSNEGFFLREGVLNEFVDIVDDLQLAFLQTLSRATFGIVPSSGEPNSARLRAIQELLLEQLLPPLPRELETTSQRFDLKTLRRNPNLLRLVVRELFQDSRMIMGKLLERQSVRFWQLLFQRAEKVLEREIELRKGEEEVSTASPPS